MTDEEKSSTPRQRLLHKYAEQGMTEAVRRRIGKTCEEVSGADFAKITKAWARTISSAPLVLILITFVLQTLREADAGQGRVYGLAGLCMLLAFVSYLFSIIVAYFGDMTANEETNKASRKLFLTHGFLKLIFYPSILAGLLMFACNEAAYYISMLLG